MAQIERGAVARTCQWQGGQQERAVSGFPPFEEGCPIVIKAIYWLVENHPADHMVHGKKGKRDGDTGMQLTRKSRFSLNSEMHSSCKISRKRAGPVFSGASGSIPGPGVA